MIEMRACHSEMALVACGNLTQQDCNATPGCVYDIIFSCTCNLATSFTSGDLCYYCDEASNLAPGAANCICRQGFGISLQNAS